MTEKLIAVTGPTAGQVFELEGDVTTIGRDPDNDIVIEAQYVSRQHCKLERTDAGIRIVDNGSHNGTSVNDVPVTAQMLTSGDRVTLGGARFLFADPEHEPEDAVGVTFEDAALPTQATMQLRVKDALYLRPEKLEDTGLRTTLQLIHLMGSTSDASLPGKILEKFLEVVPAERGAILVGESLDAIETITAIPKPFAVSRTVLTKVLDEKTAFLSNDVLDDDEAGKSLLKSRVNALVALPLVMEDQIIGAIYLDSQKPDARFPEDKLELLVGLASVGASTLEKARQLGRLRAETRRRQEEFGLVHDMVGESPKLRDAQSLIARAAPSDATVLIQGESGTGKELAARALHFNSDRRDGPIVKVDCTGLNENLLASELFGHEKGAFTGALQQKKGKLEIANGGTVFLDEIGELPLALQAQLLRVLQDREFERVGGNDAHPRRHPTRRRDQSGSRRGSEERERSVKISTIDSTSSSSSSLPCASVRATPSSSRVTSSPSSRNASSDPSPGSRRERWPPSRRHDWPGNVRELGEYDRARRCARERLR